MKGDLSQSYTLWRIGCPCIVTTIMKWVWLLPQTKHLLLADTTDRIELYHYFNVRYIMKEQYNAILVFFRSKKWYIDNGRWLCIKYHHEPEVKGKMVRLFISAPLLRVFFEEIAITTSSEVVHSCCMPSSCFVESVEARLRIVPKKLTCCRPHEMPLTWETWAVYIPFSDRRGQAAYPKSR